MRKIVLVFVLLLLLVSCNKEESSRYKVISNNPVDGYDIYEYDHSDFFCKTLYEDVFYSGKDYNYGYEFYGCNPDKTFFIKENGEYIYLLDAINLGFISIESLIPELNQLTRHPEEISYDEADYYWTDFHILGQVVYVYAGGSCDAFITETFIIDGQSYTYTANGCVKTNTLYMEFEREFVAVADLLAEGKIDGKYLIPFLTLKE